MERAGFWVRGGEIETIFRSTAAHKVYSSFQKRGGGFYHKCVSTSAGRSNVAGDKESQCLV